MTCDDGGTVVTPEFVAPWQQVLRDIRYLDKNARWPDGIEPMWASSLADAIGDEATGPLVRYTATKYVMDSMEKDLQDVITSLATLTSLYAENAVPTAEAQLALVTIRRKLRAHIYLGTLGDFTEED